MNLEQLKRVLNVIQLCLNLYSTNAGTPLKWFVSFGSLLNLLRDRGKVDGDIDLSVFFDEADGDRIINAFGQFGYKLEKKIIHNQNHRPLFLSFVPLDKGMHGDIGIDIFFWFAANNLYYHTYDYFMENPANGIPNKYVFKGIKKSILDGPIIKYQWPGTPYEVPCPLRYGEALQAWYPGFFIKDPKFGCSKAKHMVQVNRVDDLHNPSIVDSQTTASLKAYDEFENELCKKTYS